MLGFFVGSTRGLISALLVVSFTLPLFATPGLANTDPLTPAERAYLQAHGPIRHAPDPSYPPFEFFDDRGNLTGINADLLNRISRNLDIEFETVRVANWSTALAKMRSREIDLLGALAPTAERDTYMDFTPEYARLGEVFYVTDRDPSFSNVRDLVGKRVGVVKDYAAATWLTEHHPELTIEPVADTLTGLNRLSQGGLDAFFENVPVAGYYIRETSLLNIRVMGDPLYYSPVQWAVPEGDAMLRGIFEKGMASLPPGERARVFEYWTGSDISPTATAPRGLSPLARNLLGAAGLLIVAAAAWSFSLRRTVRSKTSELADLNRELEARVLARTADLAKANRDLEAFSFTISHDLRTPLTSAASYNELLRRRHGDRLDDEGRRYLDGARASTNRMGQLIEDVLRFSRAAQLPLERKDVDLSTMTKEVVDGLKAAQPDRSVDVQIAPGALAKGDPRLLRIVMENLLGNAWKFTRDRQEARIEFGQRRDPEGTTFFVRDNGAGFDPQKAQHLFQAFQRLHDTGQFEGTGIGLYTVQRLLERQGGHAWAEGTPDRGATFYFRLGATV